MRLRLRKKTKDPLWGDKEVNDDEKSAPHLLGGQALSGPLDANVKSAPHFVGGQALSGPLDAKEKSVPHLVGGQALSKLDEKSNIELNLRQNSVDLASKDTSEVKQIHPKVNGELRLEVPASDDKAGKDANDKTAAKGSKSQKGAKDKAAVENDNKGDANDKTDEAEGGCSKWSEA